MTTFSSAEPKTVALEAAGLSAQLLADILIDLDTLGEFAPENLPFLARQIGRLSSEVGTFVEAQALLSKCLGTPRDRSLHLALLGIMTAISVAIKNSDLPALEDLIKHDLKDNLAQWKTVTLQETARTPKP